MSSKRYRKLLREVADERLRALSANQLLVVRGDDVEALHDMRVASRRLRTVLELARGPDKPRGKDASAERELKRVTKVLGGPREWDVHGAGLRQLQVDISDPAERAATEYLLLRVDKKRDRLRSALGKKLAAVDLDKVGGRVRKALGGRGRSYGLSASERAAEALWPRIELAIQPLQALAQNEQPDELHRARIEVKRLRYAVEVLGELLGDAQAALLEPSKRLQEVLGRYHDACVLHGLVAERAEALAGLGHATLAGGLQNLARRIEAERARHFATFAELAREVTASGFVETVQAALGVDEGPVAFTVPAPPADEPEPAKTRKPKKAAAHPEAETGPQLALVPAGPPTHKRSSATDQRTQDGLPAAEEPRPKRPKAKKADINGAPPAKAPDAAEPRPDTTRH